MISLVLDQFTPSETFSVSKWAGLKCSFLCVIFLCVQFNLTVFSLSTAGLMLTLLRGRGRKNSAVARNRSEVRRQEVHTLRYRTRQSQDGQIVGEKSHTAENELYLNS